MASYKVRILPSAYVDLKEARSWYGQHNSTLPKQFAHNVKLSIKQIREMPFVHAVRYAGVRIANVPVFPYAIHYFTEDNFVVVIAIHHTALSPEKWRERI